MNEETAKTIKLTGRLETLPIHQHVKVRRERNRRKRRRFLKACKRQGIRGFLAPRFDWSQE